MLGRKRTFIWQEMWWRQQREERGAASRWTEKEGKAASLWIMEVVGCSGSREASSELLLVLA